MAGTVNITWAGVGETREAKKEVPNLPMPDSWQLKSMTLVLKQAWQKKTAI